MTPTARSRVPPPREATPQEDEVIQSPRAAARTSRTQAGRTGSRAGAGSAAGSGSGDLASGAGSGSGSDDAAAPVKAQPYYNPCPQPDRYYCDDSDRTCHHRIPVVMSPTMIELYNGRSSRSRYGLPIADARLRQVHDRSAAGCRRCGSRSASAWTTIAGTHTANHRASHKLSAGSRACWSASATRARCRSA